MDVGFKKAVIDAYDLHCTTGNPVHIAAGNQYVGFGTLRELWKELGLKPKAFIKKKTMSRQNDFAADVLDILCRRKVTHRGCLPDYLEFQPDGDLKMWFYGERNDDTVRGPWQGGITVMKREGLDNAFLRGDSEAFAEVIMACIEDINTRHT